MNEVSTGKIYLGNEAKRRGLVDEVMSSDQYLDLLLNTNTTILRIEAIKDSRSPFESFFDPLQASVGNIVRTVRAEAFNKLKTFMV